jgi:hypothetical protein
LYHRSHGIRLNPSRIKKNGLMQHYAGNPLAKSLPCRLHFLSSESRIRWHEH